MSAESPTRSPATVGYVPWVLHRLSALVLVALLAVHVGVQLYPTAGFVAVIEWGIYGLLLDLTLAVVLLHAFLGVRSAAIESRLADRTTGLVVWAAGAGMVLLLAVRLLL